MLLVAPSTVRRVRADSPGGRVADRLVAAVRLYQREVSPRRPPCCHFTPSCSAYAVAAIERHGALRGSWLTVRRLVRCRPGGRRGADPVPAC
nr:membrane protein insertion efficiency factor YidD [Modestobacter versicolor]